jgi:iron complex outermembrane receptor protein
VTRKSVSLCVFVRRFINPTDPIQPGLDLRLTTLNYQARYLFQDFNGYGLTVGVNGIRPEQPTRERHRLRSPYRLFDIGGFGVLKKKAFGALELTGGLRYDTRVVDWNDFYVGRRPTGFGRHADATTPGSFPIFLGCAGVDRRRAALCRGGAEPQCYQTNVAQGYNALTSRNHPMASIELHHLFGQPAFQPIQLAGRRYSGSRRASRCQRRGVLHSHVENFIWAERSDASSQPCATLGSSPPVSAGGSQPLQAKWP